MAIKIIYKNHCTPQERIDFSTGNRYYLDSDCGRKLTGFVDLSLDGSVSYTSSTIVTTSPIVIGSGKDMIYIKNLGGESADDILISLNGGVNYLLVLSPGESFTSKISDTAASLYFKCSATDSTYELIVGVE